MPSYSFPHRHKSANGDCNDDEIHHCNHNDGIVHAESSSRCSFEAQKDENIVEEGENGDAMYILRDGALEVFVSGASARSTAAAAGQTHARTQQQQQQQRPCVVLAFRPARDRRLICLSADVRLVAIRL